MNSLKSTFTQAFSGISKEVWYLSLAMLVNRSGTMVLIFMSVYATDKLNFSVTEAGTIISMFGLGSLLGVFAGGLMADKLGYRSVMIFSLISGGLLFILLAHIQNFYLITFFTFLVSLFGEAFRPANMAAISVYSKPENFTRSLSLNRLATNLGFSVGPSLGGLLASHNFSLLFYADGFSCISAAFILIFLVRDKHKMPENKQQIANINENSISPFNDKPYLLFTLLGVLYATGFFQMFSTMPLYYKEVHHLSEQQIGLLMGLNGILVAAIEMVIIYKIEHKLQPLQFVILGALLLAANYFLLFFASNYIWLIVSILLVTGSEMMAMPFMSTFMINRAGANKKGSYASFYSMTWSVAQIITPIIATQTITHAGFNTLWMILFLFGITVAIGIYILHKRLQKS